MCLEIHKESTKTCTRTKSELCNATTYKYNVQRSVLFLSIGN